MQPFLCYTDIMTPKRSAFVFDYIKHFNATRAAISAGYSPRTAKSQGARLLTNVDIAAKIKDELNTRLMSAEEALTRTARIARFDVSPYLKGFGKGAYIDTDKLIADGYGDLIRKIKVAKDSYSIEWATPDTALAAILKAHESASKATGKDGDPLHVRFIDYGLNNSGNDTTD